MAYCGFDNVTDPDLIDCYIYEVNAVLKRYKYLLEQAAKLNSLPENYFEIYLYLRRELSKADFSGNRTALDNVCSIVTDMHDAYLKISEADISKPIMENAQTVYAGLFSKKKGVLPL